MTVFHREEVIVFKTTIVIALGLVYLGFYLNGVKRFSQNSLNLMGRDIYLLLCISLFAVKNGWYLSLFNYFISTR